MLIPNRFKYAHSYTHAYTHPDTTPTHIYVNQYCTLRHGYVHTLAHLHTHKYAQIQSHIYVNKLIKDMTLVIR